MIQTPTTFVVGAGTSQPYGLPIAAGLRSQAVALDGKSWAFKFVVNSGTDPNDLRAMLEDLRDHPAESIDAFLESRQERPNAILIGKKLIAALMGVSLKNRPLKTSAASRDTDWLRYVIERMRRGAATWRNFANGNGEVRFVTFNFDTIIEERLSRAIAAIYRGSDVDVPQVVQMIPVVHVHGQLPPIPPIIFDGSLNTYGGPAPEWLAWTTRASEQINVVLEAIDDETKTKAIEAVQRAHVLCFLGFGYDPDNLKRLGFKQVLKQLKHQAKIFGSAFDMLPG
jgi:hypothetical protein